MKALRRFSAFFDRNPLAAVWLGAIAAFVLVEALAAIVKH